MNRRELILLLGPLALRLWGGETARVRGRLSGGDPVTVKTAEGRVVTLEADKPSMAVLHDERVIREEFQAVGEYVAPERFRVNPIHKKAMFVVREGKPLVITYWCAVCAIRTYSPGPCQCCQEETELDPRDPALENTAA